MSIIGSEPAFTFEGERLLAVEFSADGTPHEVFADGSAYDCDLSKAHGMLFSLSGFGHIRPYLSRLVKGSAKHSIWIAPGVDVTDGGRAHKALSNAKIEQMGYVVLNDLPVEKLNEMQSTGKILWCEVCKDSMPDEYLCSHLSFCSECGDYAYISVPRGHRITADFRRCRHSPSQRGG